MLTLITTNIQLEQVIDSAIEKAISNVAKRMTEELKSYIREDFYNQYKPRFYNRTYSFLHSPKFNLLGSNAAEIFVDTDVMHYLGVSGEYVAWLAARGYHGTTSIFRNGYYWEDFLNWANKNVPHLLKTELKKQGLDVR